MTVYGHPFPAGCTCPICETSKDVGWVKLDLPSYGIVYAHFACASLVTRHKHEKEALLAEMRE